MQKSSFLSISFVIHISEHMCYVQETGALDMHDNSRQRWIVLEGAPFYTASRIDKGGREIN